MSGAKSQTAGPMRPGPGFDFKRGAQHTHHSSGLQPTVSGDGRGAVRPGLTRLDDALSKAELGQQTAGALPGGGQRASGAGRTDGGAVGPTGGRHSDGTPRFDQAVGPGAYLWWYVDAISDDGQHALSIIAFVGSVFSPYYAASFARHGTAVQAGNHCAINVALYGPGSRRWAMTERGSASVERGADHLVVGPSQLKWTGDHLQIDLHEISVPIPQRVCGTVRVYPDALCNYSNALDDQGKHRWGPIAPCARVEVDLQKPGITWQGNAYLDSNEGDEPVTVPFKTWDWSRARMADGSTAVIYDVTQLSGAQTLLAERFKPDGSWESFTPEPTRQALAKTLWRIDRGIRVEGGKAQVLDTLEDTPFYARSLLQTQLLGEQVTAVHETLEPQRLKSRAVQMMLPWRMPRRA
jgi:carotenoid 1,2-hydratase